MTSKRNPDGVIQAWLDVMPNEAPDRAIDSVLQAIESTPQVRRPLVPAIRRFQLMNRLTYAAAAAVIVAVLAGGAWFLRPSASVGVPTTPSASPSPAQSDAAVAPDTLRSTWLANAGGPAASSGSATTFTKLVVSAAGDSLSIFDAGVETFQSRPAGGSTTELDIVSTAPAGGCQVGDLGRYGFAFGSDGTVPASQGTLLALTVIDDSCAARSAVLNRSWAHAIDADSHGGRGIATVFSPMFLVTLPEATYTAGIGPDALTVTSTTPDRTLIAVHNPAGWSDPCSQSGGSKRSISPTIAAFTAYMRTLPGFTVQSSNLKIDGHTAVLLTIPTTQTADCASHRVNEWSSSSPADTGGWLLRQGDTDVVYLVQVGGDLVLLQWLGAGVTTAEEQALWATVHFTATLPQ